MASCRTRTIALISYCQLLLILVIAADVPVELYSPIIGQKLLKIASNETAGQYPEYTDRENGAWQYFDPNVWTVGFFPSTLYALNNRSKLCPSLSDGTDWLSLGRQWSTGEIPYETTNELVHDVGFASFPFQDELLVNSANQTALTAVNDFATDLANRYNPIVGCTRSWDPAEPFEVIIDNMMNLEVLFVSAGLTGNDTLRQIAISHADHTIANHVRPDGSSFHVVEYDSSTGSVVRRWTAQGYADNSTWSRGQAWGIYGFAIMFANTGTQRYLDTSRSMATYFKNNLPSDGIVPWDFDAPLTPPRPADTSAATIAATALLLLSRMEQSLSPPNTTGSQIWSDFAIQLLDKVTTLAWKPSWQSLLSNGTVDNHNQPLNNLTGIVYGDYYYVKAGNDLLSMGLTQCPSKSSTTGSGSSPRPSSSGAATDVSRLLFLVMGVVLAVTSGNL
ncbi:glycoside hydrolase family 88 protein [Rickenella mellea]|uniref:Glycoside hydrolase family 88 protein n=1 Tax=Rickenella mellea TaxID=50990 RepID=A0A4Y7QJ17_9AGAM|nr:glycoside hydrolase family 88 protein [Rickenella mellea]